MCEELQEMGRKELLADYLTPLKFQHNGPGSRSLTSLKGGKRRNDWSGKLSETSIGLYSITVNLSTAIVTVQRVCVCMMLGVTNEMLEYHRAKAV